MKGKKDKKAKAAKKVRMLLSHLNGSLLRLNPLHTMRLLCRCPHVGLQDSSFEGKLRRKILLLSRQLQVGPSRARWWSVLLLPGALADMGAVIS